MTQLFHRSLPVLFVNFDLNVNDLESVMLSFGSFGQYCHKLPDASEKLWLYSIKLYIDIVTSRSLTLSTNVLFISLR